jgi:hypothetical protein
MVLFMFVTVIRVLVRAAALGWPSQRVDIGIEVFVYGTSRVEYVVMVLAFGRFVGCIYDACDDQH